MAVDGARPLLEPAVAIVTGGARGIGACLTDALACAHADVAVVSRTAPTSRQTEHFARAGQKLHWFPTDLAVLHDESTEQLVQEIERACGPVSILVNNAGGIVFGPTATMPLADWDRLFRVNVTANLLLSRTVARGMQERRYGRIVNVTSVLGLTGKSNLAAYVASKHALTGLTKALAAEWGGWGITVNAIAPGDIHSDPERPPPAVSERASVGRYGIPEDLTSCVVWLASREASFVNGQTIVVDGGLLAQ